MNAHVHNTRNALTYSGHVIRDRDEMLSLTDMWKAAGSDQARRPTDWLRSADAQRFTDFLAEAQNVGNSHLFSAADNTPVRRI